MYVRRLLLVVEVCDVRLFRLQCSSALIGIKGWKWTPLSANSERIAPPVPNKLDGSYTLVCIESNEGLIVTLDLYNGLLQRREGPSGVENEQPSFL